MVCATSFGAAALAKWTVAAVLRAPRCTVGIAVQLAVTMCHERREEQRDRRTQPWPRRHAWRHAGRADATHLPATAGTSTRDPPSNHKSAKSAMQPCSVRLALQARTPSVSTWPIKLRRLSTTSCGHPLVDVAALRAPPGAARAAAVATLRKALVEHGYFYAANVETLPASYIASIYAYSKRSVHQPNVRL